MSLLLVPTNDRSQAEQPAPIPRKKGQGLLVNLPSVLSEPVSLSFTYYAKHNSLFFPRTNKYRTY
jgi:hypothetical protein